MAVSMLENAYLTNKVIGLDGGLFGADPGPSINGGSAR